MSVKIEKGNALSFVPMTPMIDVVFNLLIFFLVATKIEDAEREMEAAKEKELQVSLAEASEARPLFSSVRGAELYVTKEGKFFIAGAFHGENEVKAMLKQMAVNNPGDVVTIRVDRAAATEFTFRAINMCLGAPLRYKLAAADPTAVPAGGN